MRPSLSTAAACALTVALGSAFLPTTSYYGELPDSAANVWRIATKAGDSASACPVQGLDEDTWLFLTAKHVTAGWTPGFTQAIVEDKTRLRKLVIISAEDHPTKDISIIKAKGDGKPIDLFSLDFVGNELGDIVYTVGYPGPETLWLGFRGYRGMEHKTSSYVESGMSGGALLDINGNLTGILIAHAYFIQTLDAYDKNLKYLGNVAIDRHLPHQSTFLPLKGLEDWLRKFHVVK